MQANQGPQSGINAWLEEELLQQYHHDRASVDADWKNIFDHDVPGVVALTKGNGKLGNGNGSSHLPVPEVVLSGSEELMPLRGAAARIAGPPLAIHASRVPPMRGTRR